MLRQVLINFWLTHKVALGYMDLDLAQCHNRARRQATLTNAEVEHDRHLPPAIFLIMSLNR